MGLSHRGLSELWVQCSGKHTKRDEAPKGFIQGKQPLHNLGSAPHPAPRSSTPLPTPPPHRKAALHLQILSPVGTHELATWTSVMTPQMQAY